MMPGVISKVVRCLLLHNKSNPRVYSTASSTPHRLLEYNPTNIVHSTLPNIKVCDSTIPEYVFRNFGMYPNKIAVECAETGKKYTFEELRTKSRNFGKNLRKMFKLRKGDVVATLVPNIPEFPVAMFGALYAALTVTMLNPKFTKDEIRRQLTDSNAKLLITSAQLWTTAYAVVGNLPNKLPIIAIRNKESDALPDGSINFQELADVNCDSSIIEENCTSDIAFILYSSGTTGAPKAVEYSTRNVVANLQQLYDPCVRLGHPTTEIHQEIVPAVLPWFHLYGLTMILLNNLQNLHKLLALAKFSTENYINMLDKHQPNILYLVAPLVALTIDNPLVQKRHLQSIHTVFCSAAPVSAVDEQKLKAKAGTPIRILQGYGLTECGLVMLLPPKLQQRFGFVGSIGQPLPNTSIKVMPTNNPFGKPFGANETGEFFVKGPQITKCYRNKPQETINAFVDGWFRTGDVGYYDENKLFYITNRLKDLIKVNAYQVSPSELEDLIRNYPGVSEVVVIGIPHALYGQVPRAYIVQNLNCKVDIAKLQNYVSSKVSKIKHLKGGIIIIDNIPRNASGKVLKNQLYQY